MFRLTHISDTHGMVPYIPQSSLLVVHSGDMAPNATRGRREIEEKYQEEWWNNPLVLGEFCERIGDRYFVFIPGNHDYFDPEALLREAGIKAHNIANRSLTLLGSTFYGFPYIPYIQGEWNYETRADEMGKLVAAIPGCDFLVAHCPPFGICADVFEGKGGGNSVLANWLAYWDVDDREVGLPSYILCGHFHESRGIGKLVVPQAQHEILVSNAATVQHTFEIG